MEVAKELPARGVQKPTCRVGEKWFPVGFSAASCCNGEETRGSENKTRLEAVGPPGWAAAGVVIAPGPGSVHSNTRLEPAHGDDLSLPDLEGEGAGSPERMA